MNRPFIQAGRRESGKGVSGDKGAGAGRGEGGTKHRKSLPFAPSRNRSWREKLLLKGLVFQLLAWDPHRGGPPVHPSGLTRLSYRQLKKCNGAQRPVPPRAGGGGEPSKSSHLAPLPPLRGG